MMTKDDLPYHLKTQEEHDDEDDRKKVEKVDKWIRQTPKMIQLVNDTKNVRLKKKGIKMLKEIETYIVKLLIEIGEYEVTDVKEEKNDNNRRCP